MKVNILIPPSTWMGALVPAQLKDIWCVPLEEKPGFCFITEQSWLNSHHWTSWLFFLCSCIPLLPWRSPITEACSRARSRPGLDHRMALAKKNHFFYVKKAMPGSLSPRTSPHTHQLIGVQMPFSPAFSLQSVEPHVPSPTHLWCSQMISRSLNYYYLEQEAKERKASRSMTKMLSTSQ